MKVLVVDQQPTMRLGIRRAIEDEEGVIVIFEAGSPEEAIRLAEGLRPDMIVMDLVLEGSNSGLRLFRVLKSRADAPSIAAHTTYNSEEDVFLSRLAGADSFVSKGEETAKLMEA